MEAKILEKAAELSRFSAPDVKEFGAGDYRAGRA
jgi:hypothetical protein